jgi:hypothetical protein
MTAAPHFRQATAQMLSNTTSYNSQGQSSAFMCPTPALSAQTFAPQGVPLGTGHMNLVAMQQAMQQARQQVSAY